ncbi:hypothetical protein F2P56_013457 [Juglans regia]|uniref:Uncharacterized protein LOC108989530 n=2 Tax=Juglans regia TaxID=51240 RepID=A0A2I4EH45_JUGRE|nr:uncharacterized protein LOC108989530 [Juglans regia]KAF5469377.1 hypothetical protein F2P56_013457 [Juglans regia]
MGGAGPSKTRNEAHQKSKQKGRAVWRKLNGQTQPKLQRGPSSSAGAGPSQLKAQTGGQGPGCEDPAQRREHHSGVTPSLSFVPKSLQMVEVAQKLPTTAVEIADEVADEASQVFCAQKEFEIRENATQILPTSMEGTGLDPAKLSVRPLEISESEVGDEESEDLMHSVEDDLVLFESCDQLGLEEFSVGEDFQNFQSSNPIPLNYCFPDQASDWVLHKVKEIQHFVGINCEGYEVQFIALLTAMEAGYQ